MQNEEENEDENEINTYTSQRVNENVENIYNYKRTTKEIAKIIKEEFSKLDKLQKHVEKGLSFEKAEIKTYPHCAWFYTKKEDKKQNEREEKPKPKRLTRKFYEEKQLSHKQKERLFARGFKRLKISPFGDSGAAYYWITTRHNESKEHAFFCYLIEQELKKHSSNVVTHTTQGPDVKVEHNGKQYCFDVETGKSLSRQPKFLEHKFSNYERDYDESFILVTNKKLKYAYKKYGKVITRATLKKTIARIFKLGIHRYKYIL